MRLLIVAVGIGVLVGCRSLIPSPPGPEIVSPQTVGLIARVTPINGAVERWTLITGARVDFDLNKTINAYRSELPAAGVLVLAGKMSGGSWVMQLGAGALGPPADCFAIRLNALDRPHAVEFIIPTDENVRVEGGWRVSVTKGPTFGWQPGGSPREDGTYPPDTRFCLNDRGEVTGQPPPRRN